MADLAAVPNDVHVQGKGRSGRDCGLQLVVRPPEVTLPVNAQSVEHAVHVRVYRECLEPEREQQDAVDALCTEPLYVAELVASRIEVHLDQVVEIVRTSLLIQSGQNLLDPARLDALQPTRLQCLFEMLTRSGRDTLPVRVALA